jgi:DNA polymerase
MKPLPLHLDFETRSECDLQQAGAYVYARHPSTVVLCAAYALGNQGVRYWSTAAGTPMPQDLARALHNSRVKIHAWNA